MSELFILNPSDLDGHHVSLQLSLHETGHPDKPDHLDAFILSPKVTSLSPEKRLLLSFRLDANSLIPLQTGSVVPAQRTKDHRLMYFDFNGAIPGGKGLLTVQATLPDLRLSWQDAAPNADYRLQVGENELTVLPASHN